MMVGTISRRIVPVTLMNGEVMASTDRRWQIRAPRSWPARMMHGNCNVLHFWRRILRALRISLPTLRLEWGVERGGERP